VKYEFVSGQCAVGGKLACRIYGVDLDGVLCQINSSTCNFVGTIAPKKKLKENDRLGKNQIKKDSPWRRVAHQAGYPAR
jgi:hypothetical protein